MKFKKKPTGEMSKGYKQKNHRKRNQFHYSQGNSNEIYNKN
jgi:hypothetical protein